MALGVPEFRRALIRLGGALDSDIGKLIAAIGGLDVPAAMRLVTDAYPELASPYLALAADLTATWYEEQPAAAGAKPFTAQPAELPAVEQLAANARWALTQSNPTTALQRSGQSGRGRLPACRTGHRQPPLARSSSHVSSSPRRGR